MGMIKIYQGKGKPAKKKPGWQQQQAEYEAWLKKIQSMSSGISKPKTKVSPTKLVKVVVEGPVIDESRLIKHKSLQTTGGAGTKPVHRPEIMYKDNPELIEREIKARERKFATAPAYNKGPAQFVSEDMDADMKKGLLRRR